MNNILLLATNNEHKLSEIKSLFIELPLKVTTLQEQGINFEVEESGLTFKENAILKATQYAKLSGLLTLADDSGIVVKALNGKPGVYSARYAGKDATDIQNQQKLLQELKNVSKENRQAYYKCVFALATPESLLGTFSGKMNGLITTRPEGKNGFGYDPIFYVPQFKKTAAQITQTQKNSISHRRQAIKKLKNYLESLNIY